MNVLDFGIQEELAFLDFLFEQPRCDDQLVFCRKAAQALDGGQGNQRVETDRIENFPVLVYGDQIDRAVGYARRHVIGDHPEPRPLEHLVQGALERAVAEYRQAN